MRAILAILVAFPAFANLPVGNTDFSIPTTLGLFARYDFHEGTGTTAHNVFNPGTYDLTIASGCTWALGNNGGSQGLTMTSSGTCGMPISDAEFNASRTICVVATLQNGSSYRAIISNPGQNSWYIWQDGYNLTTVNFGSGSQSNRTYNILNNGNYNFALGTTNMVCWARDVSADHFYVGPNDVGQYSSQSGSAGYVASGASLTFGRDLAFGSLGFNNTFFEILFFSQELTQPQVAKVFRAETAIQNAKAVATGGGGQMNGGLNVNTVGASIYASSQLPGCTGPQAGGWDLATLISPGNNVAGAAGYVNHNIITASAVTQNGAIQGASAPVLSACGVEFANCNSSGGDAVLGAFYNYRIEAKRNIFIDAQSEVNNSIAASLTAAQVIASHQQFIGYVSPFFTVISFTYLLTTVTQSGTNNTYLLAVNADTLANSVSYGSTATYDLYSQPNAQDLTTTYRCDGVHPNQFGATQIMTPSIIAALRQVYVY